MSKFITLLLTLFFQAIQADLFPLIRFNCTSKTHYEFGYCIGEQTEALIKERFNRSTHFQNLYEWVQTPNGSLVLTQFLTNNYNKYPLYFEEMYGISNGSNVDLLIVYVMTFDDELSYFYPSNVTYNVTTGNTAPYPNYKHPMACSDYLVQNYAMKNDHNGEQTEVLMDYWLAHNEDNIPECRNVTFIIDASISGQIPFVVYSYAGELPTQAFGYNDYIVFSSNYVDPANPVIGGIGRNMIGRTLLTSTSLQEAMKVVSQDGQCGGHNYQIAEWTTGNMTGAEVAYDGLHAFTVISAAYNWTFHANRYIHLNISQEEDGDWVSSVHREARAAQLGRPSDLDDMLNDLGDTEDEQYPIYKYGPSDYTLHTFGVNVKNCSWIIYGDNPKLRNVIFEGSVRCKSPLPL